MGYLIGTDEAGYGPKLGPLVVSATVWQVPPGVRGGDLYGLLGHVITAKPDPVAQGCSARLPVADSKTLYRSGKGLRQLERGVLGALAILRRRPDSWPEAFDRLAPDSAAGREEVPWYADYQSPLPLAADPAELEPLGSTLRQALDDAGVRLVELRSRAVFARQFNRLAGQHDSKGALLSHLTLDLVAQVMNTLPDEPISIVCDKHGGRNRYGRLLAGHFPDWLIEVHGESRSLSTYRFGPQKRRVEIRFQAKAESHLPVALASMASKYLRELAMRALNGFWCSRVPRLLPTAGYPQDARRFKAKIEPLQAKLGIDDALLWRVK